MTYRLITQIRQLFKQIFAHALVLNERSTHTLFTTGGVEVSPMVRTFATGMGIRSHHFYAIYSGRLSLSNIGFRQHY